MKPNNLEQPLLEKPLAALERQLIDAYLAGAGQNFHDLMTRDDGAARQLRKLHGSE